MDALSDVLAAVHLTGAVFLEMEMREDWSYLTAPARAIADVLMPEADHVGHRLEISGESLREMLKRDEVSALREGKTGKAARIVCGFLACDGQHGGAHSDESAAPAAR